MSNAIHRTAVLGDPIEHSLSPILHNAAYEALQLDNWEYSRAQVNTESLHDFLHSLDSSWAGLSLTMPLKKDIIRYGITTDPWVKSLNVANTVVFDWSQQNSYDSYSSDNSSLPYMSLANTDVPGIVHAITEAAEKAASGVANVAKVKSTTQTPDTTFDRVLSFSPHSALVLGSGSTAGSAIAAAYELGISQLCISARSPEKAQDLAKLAQSLHISVSVVPLNEAFSEHRINSDVVISTIPAHGCDAIAANLRASLDSSAKDAEPHGILLDVVYDPRPTDLMQAWQSINPGKTIAIGGEHMLLHQAIGQISFMTSIPIFTIIEKALPHMRAALQEVL